MRSGAETGFVLISNEYTPFLERTREVLVESIDGMHNDNIGKIVKRYFSRGDRRQRSVPLHATGRYQTAVEDSPVKSETEYMVLMRGLFMSN